MSAETQLNLWMLQVRASALDGQLAGVEAVLRQFFGLSYDKRAEISSDALARAVLSAVEKRA